MCLLCLGVQIPFDAPGAETIPLGHALLVIDLMHTWLHKTEPHVHDISGVPERKRSYIDLPSLERRDASPLGMGLWCL